MLATWFSSLLISEPSNTLTTYLLGWKYLTNKRNKLYFTFYTEALSKSNNEVMLK